MALKLQAEMSLDGSGIKRGIDKALGDVKGMIAGAFTLGAITAFTQKTIEFAGHIDDLSKRLGVSTDYLQEMQFVMKQNGGSVDDLTLAFEKLGAARIAALSGDEKASANFAKFGIGIETLKTAAPQALMDTIAAQFKLLGNNDEIKSAFKEIGGKGAGALVPAFVEGLESGREDARKAGAVIKSEYISQLDEIGDKFERLSQILMVEIAPAIIAVAEAAKYLIEGIKENASFWGAASANINPASAAKAVIKGAASANPAVAAIEILKLIDTKAGTTAEAESFKGFVESEAAAAEARRKRAAAWLENDYSGINPPPAKPEKIPAAKSVAAFSDSLLSVGNFLGAGRQTLETVAQKQLTIQTQILSQLTKIANKGESTIKVP